MSLFGEQVSKRLALLALVWKRPTMVAFIVRTYSRHVLTSLKALIEAVLAAIDAYSGSEKPQFKLMETLVPELKC